MITKKRKQGNSIMLTVPKDFNVPNGVEVEAKLVENGILYEFVEPQKEFFDFSEDILSDIIAEGYDKDKILVEFKNRKSNLVSSFRNIATDALTNSKAMSKEELAKEVGL
ncbi:AbrB family transcriptional regulator [Enterococcus mundtii]|uniref:AbrB family transcriptional regulator n=1 Tax=Enterococcus mundtii TaxID=53346 RepID=A0ABQ0VGT5_ENTMU|nr:AbrB family transcriptional regulator [Enterococcus mundtii]EMF0110762.1 AbrB family transcriptional regulator [Enterococcus hirae]MZU11390.1 AbrB family transcriptional regulator [Bifidobacterium longum]GEN18541.1 AbrB family transcriptional regulator [Ligilactobacillus acidipiscis]AUB54488.1 AbrB family transcriptional regulator [Enterococcus mundtii]MDB7088689.1 AbrB family transcriptional regulator [Enterococcus mundtii]